jgi:hypothetical protein
MPLVECLPLPVIIVKGLAGKKCGELVGIDNGQRSTY